MQTAVRGRFLEERIPINSGNWGVVVFEDPDGKRFPAAGVFLRQLEYERLRPLKKSTQEDAKQSQVEKALTGRPRSKPLKTSRYSWLQGREFDLLGEWRKYKHRGGGLEDQFHFRHMFPAGARDLLLGLTDLGFDFKQACRLYFHWGYETGATFEKFPYAAVEVLPFKAVDEAAVTLGVGRHDPGRLVGAAAAELIKEHHEGHCYTDRNSIVQRVMKKLSVSRSLVDSAIDTSEESQMLLAPRGDFLQLQFIAEAEWAAAKYIEQKLTYQKSAPDYVVETRTATVEAAPIQFDDLQLAAISLIRNRSVGIVTGPPGSGKTTILREALKRLHVSNSGYVLCAPTGKAARRMEEACGEEARTMHSILGYDRDSDTFRFSDHNPLPRYDVIVIDEASMIDIVLFKSMLAAMRRETRLILIGDEDQLPPVQAGAPFRDLLNWVPCVRLEVSYRAAEQSWITRNAPRIIEGDFDGLELDDSEKFQWRIVGAPEEIQEHVCGIMEEYEPEDLHAVQVITPQKRIAGGVLELNAALKHSLNPHPQGPGWKVFFEGQEQMIHAGDRVLQNANNTDINVQNGEIGTVLEQAKSRMVVNMDGRAVNFSRGDSFDLSLGFAITIHKSQGSEWDAVLVVCHSNVNPRMLTRQLLYTAVTRAKDEVYIIGDEEGLRRAVETEQEPRRTLFVQCLREAREQLEDEAAGL